MTIMEMMVFTPHLSPLGTQEGTRYPIFCTKVWGEEMGEKEFTIQINCGYIQF
jgi:hypothetical protein